KHTIVRGKQLNYNIKSTMTFVELSQKLLKHAIDSFPQEVLVPGESRSGLFRSTNIFWEKIATLRKYTDSGADNFSEKHHGSTGWEYEIMMAYIDGKFFYSSPTTSKDYTQVQSKHSLRFEMEHDPRSKTPSVKDHIFIDDKKVGSLVAHGPEQIQARNRKMQEKTFQAGFVCHFHSHPQIQLQGSKRRIYTFFSPQDLNSLMYGSTPIMGLVTDRLWLLVKPPTNNLPPTRQELQEVTRVEVQDPESLTNAAGKLMQKYNWTLYTAKFGAGKLVKV
ncbi:hypothetical protein KC640_01720, partial [Candidatus Dojkabacteria bacterium]|nr:hypothetical protein [Candidatus Dojkabacteria bacterium]